MFGAHSFLVLSDGSLDKYPAVCLPVHLYLDFWVVYHRIVFSNCLLHWISCRVTVKRTRYVPTFAFDDNLIQREKFRLVKLNTGPKLALGMYILTCHPDFPVIPQGLAGWDMPAGSLSGNCCQWRGPISFSILPLPSQHLIWGRHLTHNSTRSKLSNEWVNERTDSPFETLFLLWSLKGCLTLNSSRTLKKTFL